MSIGILLVVFNKDINNTFDTGLLKHVREERSLIFLLQLEKNPTKKILLLLLTNVRSVEVGVS